MLACAPKPPPVCDIPALQAFNLDETAAEAHSLATEIDSLKGEVRDSRAARALTAALATLESTGLVPVILDDQGLVAESVIDTPGGWVGASPSALGMTVVAARDLEGCDLRFAILRAVEFDEAERVFEETSAPAPASFP